MTGAKTEGFNTGEKKSIISSNDMEKGKGNFWDMEFRKGASEDNADF